MDVVGKSFPENVKNIVAAVQPLMMPGGRLSAKSIAAEFEISTDQLAAQIGQPKQALSKKPDAPEVQELLRPYERVFHLRAIFSKSDFLAWLERPNREIDDSSPMELINAGHADIIADLVEDMLLGTPA